MTTVLDKVNNLVDRLTKDTKNEEPDLSKSLVNRHNANFYIAYKDGNITLLGDILPDDTEPAETNTAGKYILLVARGRDSWSVKYSIETLEDDTSQSAAQDKALKLAESNKNEVRSVSVCQGINRMYSDRPIYQAFVTFSYISKKDMLLNEIQINKIYSSVDEVPDYVPSGKRKQWMEVWNSAYKKTKSEASAFRQANGVVKKSLADEAKSDTLENFIELKKENFVDGLVYGVVYEPFTKDSHGDWTSAEEIEKWAHNFLPSALENGSWSNKSHDNDKGNLTKQDVEVVECYIAPCDFEFPSGEKVIKGSWVLVSRVNNEELKNDILSGEATGYSLEGMGKRLDIDF